MVAKQRIRSLTLLVVLALIALPAAPARAQEATPQQRAEVRKLIRERDNLYQRLEALDARALEVIRQGEDPVEIYAQQVTIQDRLDLVLLQLEVLATRYNLPIPALPGEEDVRTEAVPTDEELEREIQRSFARGRSRAMSQLLEDYERFLRSLDFGSFLANTP